MRVRAARHAAAVEVLAQSQAYTRRVPLALKPLQKVDPDEIEFGDASDN